MSQLSCKRIERYLDLAKNASMNSDFPKHQLGAVLIYKGSLLACGCNNRKTSPTQKKYNKARNYDVDANYGFTNCTHAEVACLNKVKYLDIQFDKAVLYIFRQHKNGCKALAKPCKACEAMIRNLGIKEIVYTTENGWSHEHYD